MGVDPGLNKAKALDLYRLAALAGLTEAMNALALLLEETAASREAKARPEDPFSAAAVRDLLVEASKWYLLSRKKGTPCCCNLTSLFQVLRCSGEGTRRSGLQSRSPCLSPLKRRVYHEQS